MEDMENRLKLALVVFVGGARLSISREQVVEALVIKAGIPREAFLVHLYKPDDFLRRSTSGVWRRGRSWNTGTSSFLQAVDKAGIGEAC